MQDLAKDFLELLGISLAALAATVCGVAGGYAFVRDVTHGQRIAVSLAGIGLGCYGAAAFTSYFGVNPAVGALAGFGLGFLSFPLLAFAFGFVNRLAKRSEHYADRVGDGAIDKVLGKDDAPKGPPAAGS